MSALVASLSGPYRQSYRHVCGLMDEVCGVGRSRGAVGRWRAEMSQALSAPVAAAKAYVQTPPILHSDETGFPQENQEGGNLNRTKGWMWVLVSFFEVALSRSQQTAKDLISEAYSGIVTSDRSTYGWIELAHWQGCWAHLKRDFTAIAERTGVSQGTGEALLRHQRRLFRWWRRVSDGTLTRAQFIARIAYLRQDVKTTLAETAALPIEADEKSPFAKTIKTCGRLLKVEPALWTFVDTVGVEPSNNAAKPALRPAVIWRKTSFGTQSQSGSQFVARRLSVSISLKAQGRDILDFLMQACLATRAATEPPSLLPQQQR